MSTPSPRDFRPKLHFTAPSMWLNDPNGLVLENGVYHLYYQYHPHDTVWGPMHWGHAVSRDLYHWEHCPIALYPDKLGTVFSGSAVVDEENVSGLGENGKAPLLAFFTSHGETEQQSMAWSLDGGMTFTRFSENPIIPNPGVKDFRDPKVFRNPVLGGFSMIVSAHDRAMLYHSSDLKHWEKTGEFGPVPQLSEDGFVWECPDLFPLSCNGKEVWVLVLSVVFPALEEGNRTCYFVGDFDGKTFLRHPGSAMERLDAGPDFYAGSSYWGTAERTFISWQACPGYAGEVPTGEYCGQMTLPRVFTLVDTPSGYKVAAKPVGMDEKLQGGQKAGEALPGETFALRIMGTGAGSVTFFNGQGEEVVFGIDEDNCLFADRSRSTSLHFSEVYEKKGFQQYRCQRFTSGAWQIDAVFDVSSLELWVDEGTRWMTQLLFPAQPYTGMRIQGELEVQLWDLTEMAL